MELLNHLKHPHPLVLSEEKYDDIFCCMVCWDALSGVCYCCNECIFVMHKWCAELPLEVSNHHVHHPALVLLSSEERDRMDAVCEDCKLEIDISYAFSCKECSFVLHPECALLPKQIEFQFNDANSLPARIGLEFTKRPGGGWSPCQLCKQGLHASLFKHNADSYHIQCARLPKTVKHDKHIHELTLHVPIKKEKDYNGCYCDLCEGERDVNEWLYYCAKCEVAGHLSCGLIGSPLLYKGILTSNRVYTVESEKPPPVVDEDMEEYMRALAIRVERTPENEKPLGELVHFSHGHQLSLFNDFWDGMSTCRACDTFAYGNVYTCLKCNFFLHKWCAELPLEVHFGFHFQHPLTLSSNQKLGCSYCKVRNDEFSYSCLECDFEVHTTCAFLYEFTSLDKSHGHPLQIMFFVPYKHDWAFIGKIPVKSGKTPPPCNACLFPCNGMSLGCDECGFYLHVGCSLYPPTGKAESHMHNLNLTYDYKDDTRYTEFICDACEKPRTPNCWVYCCPDPKCDIVAHLDCGISNLFHTSSSLMIKHQDDCSSSHNKEERNLHDDWVYYRPSPSLYLLHGFEKPKLDKPIQLILKRDPVYAFLKDKVSGSIQKAKDLQHFSHEHILVLSNEKWNGNVACQACSRGIYGETYICHDCGYYLHKWCAQIPRELHFKLHAEHPLTLLPGHDFECCVCGANNFGFSFSCEKCRFEAHTICALMPGRNKLESHEHPVEIVYYSDTPIQPRRVKSFLFPRQNDGPMPICDACHFPCQGMTMECTQCEFHLHVSCAWYPRTINTEAHDIHTLTLDNSTDYFSFEIIPISHRYFCDVCDKALTEHRWGYICLDEKCNTIAAHLDCALPNLFLTLSFQSILVDPDQ